VSCRTAVRTSVELEGPLYIPWRKRLDVDRREQWIPMGTIEVKWRVSKIELIICVCLVKSARVDDDSFASTAPRSRSGAYGGELPSGEWRPIGRATRLVRASIQLIRPTR
jgi:hypothetical protein